MTFTDVHRGRQKVPKSDFQSQFSMSKIIRIFLNFFSQNNISLGPHFLKNTFFDNFKTERLLFLKWRLIFDGPCEHLWKSNQKIILILLIFLLKSSSCWLTSAQLHHWGHTRGLGVQSFTISTRKMTFAWFWLKRNWCWGMITSFGLWLDFIQR